MKTPYDTDTHNRPIATIVLTCKLIEMVPDIESAIIVIGILEIDEMNAICIRGNGQMYTIHMGTLVALPFLKFMMRLFTSRSLWQNVTGYFGFMR